jgi:hypothetical protein
MKKIKKRDISAQSKILSTQNMAGLGQAVDNIGRGRL